MKKKILFISLVLLTLPILAQNRADSIRMNLINDTTEILVVSHRADWRNAPENSIQAIKNCIKMGVDIVEIDLKKTKDGQLILMHDKTINRTTTGKGRVENYTLSELKQFYLRNGAGHKTAHRIPTFQEVMLLCKGKIMVNVDKGYNYFKEVYAILQKTRTTKQCIIKANLPYKQVKAENGTILDKVIFMPVIVLDQAKAASIIESYISHMRPIAYELVFKNNTPKIRKLIQKIRSTGAKIFINSLWAELCGGHHDDRAVEQEEPDESWGWIINQGAKLIQTDRPKELLEYLKTKGLKH